MKNPSYNAGWAHDSLRNTGRGIKNDRNWRYVIFGRSLMYYHLNIGSSHSIFSIFFIEAMQKSLVILLLFCITHTNGWWSKKKKATAAPVTTCRYDGKTLHSGYALMKPGMFHECDHLVFCGRNGKVSHFLLRNFVKKKVMCYFKMLRMIFINNVLFSHQNVLFLSQRKMLLAYIFTAF